MRRALAAAMLAALLAGPVAGALGAGAASASPAAPSVRAAAARAVAARAAALPTVHGGYGQTPRISFPRTPPPKTLVSRVLHRGSGPVVRSGDVIAVDYTGQIWRGKVFDSTFLSKFGHETPLATLIGLGKVVPGWDDGLPGKTVGSRVLLVIPPKWGYGSGGNSQAGIKGTDTLVFVVDILGAWGKGASAGHGTKYTTTSRGGVTVTGSLERAPHVRVARSARQPKKAAEVVLSRGHGPAVRGGLVVFEEFVTDWTGKTVDSTWTQYPTYSTFSMSSASSASSSGSDPFAGIPVGSRVLFLEPKSSQGGPYVVVVDIVADLTTR